MSDYLEGYVKGIYDSILAADVILEQGDDRELVYEELMRMIRLVKQ